MRSVLVPLFIIGYYIAYATCDGYNSNKELSSFDRINEAINGGDSNGFDNTDEFIDKRAERYGFKLGRRAYTYTNGGPGVKRLPVYNFGLGKRAARPYSFGLGKRNMINENSEEDYQDSKDSVQSPSSYDSPLSSYHLYLPYDNKFEDSAPIKRGRPYSFGLGKRMVRDLRRLPEQRYNFGLGKR